jgi:hypothetical protein
MPKYRHQPIVTSDPQLRALVDDINLRFRRAERGFSTLGSLTDVEVTGVTDGEILTYDSATLAWINQTLAEAGIAPTVHTHVEADITDLGNYPEKDQVETISAAWSFTGNLSLSNAAPTLYWYDSDGIDYRIQVNSSRMYLSSLDAGNAGDWRFRTNDSTDHLIMVAGTGLSWGGGSAIASSDDVAAAIHTHLEARA